MSRNFVGSLVVLTALFASVLPANAGGPGGGSSFRARHWFSETITTTVLTATLDPYDSSVEPTGTGLAQYTTTTVDVVIFGRTWTTTWTTLGVNVSGLSDTDGTVLSLELNQGTQFGSAVVGSGMASFWLSSKRGATVPVIVEGDHLDVIIANSSTTYVVHNDFSAPVTTVTHLGR